MNQVSVVIPVYQPDMNIFKQVIRSLKSQTIKPEILEMWNNREVVSMNKGIKKAKGKIIILLAQDCLPLKNDWIENLIKPLEDKNISASVSSLILTEDYWNSYPFMTKILTMNELKRRTPMIDIRACAYRKETLKEINYINEDPKFKCVDLDHQIKIKKLGTIEHPDVTVAHLHPLDNKKKLSLDYKYAKGGGFFIKLFGTKDPGWYMRFLRGFPILGMAIILLSFPYNKPKHYYLFPIYIFFIPLSHIIYMAGFWKGLLISEKEVIA